MRHGISGRKLGRTSSHRKALFANLATSLIKHGQIRTTLPKAKELRRIVDPLITLGKKGDLSARRQAARTITEAEVVKYLFDSVAPAMAKRAGGYTRVLKAGFRLGDAAEMAVVELTDQPKKAFGEEAPKAQPAKKEKSAAPKKAASKKPAAKEAAPAKKAVAKKAAPAKEASAKKATAKPTAKKAAPKKAAAKAKKS